MSARRLSRSRHSSKHQSTSRSAAELHAVAIDTAPRPDAEQIANYVPDTTYSALPSSSLSHAPLTSEVQSVSDEQDESSSLLSPAPLVHAEARLNRLIQPEEKFQSSKRPVKHFYGRQNEFVDSLLKLNLLTNDDKEEEEDEKPSTAAYLAIQLSLALTFVLLGMKMFIAIYSGSIAVISSAVDSILDVLSQSTMMFLTRAMRKYDPYKYPAGKSRMEPVSVLIFSIIMGMAAIFLLYECVTNLVDGLEANGKDVKMDAVTITILALVIGVQFVMWIYCRRLSKLPIPGANSMDALAQDHINDVCINIIGGVPAIVAGLISSAWIADPIGGIVLSIYIIVRWVHTAWEQLPALTGKTAPPEFLNQLTYLAGTHDRRILEVDTVLAYHIGDKYLCEVHIVLPSDMSLREAHDIGESLEEKFEMLDSVESAFVHLDYETSHEPEHKARAKAAGKEKAKKLAGQSVVGAVESAPAVSMPGIIGTESNPLNEPVTAAYTVPSSLVVSH